jgi:hypothetical protein
LILLFWTEYLSKHKNLVVKLGVSVYLSLARKKLEKSAVVTKVGRYKFCMYLFCLIYA